MARAIERHCGRECVGRLFEKSPLEFFRQYIALCRQNTGLVRFAPETERFIMSLR